MSKADWNTNMFSGGKQYIYYNNKFVARFKYHAGGKTHFKNFLIRNFTPEEYFSLRETFDMLPLKILETKGYVSPNMARACKSSGFPETSDGVAGMLKHLAEEECEYQ